MPPSDDVFEQFRRPRFGTTNPERMTNPWWDHAVRAGANAYRLRLPLGAQWRHGAGDRWHNDPDWCFDRYGMTQTPLPDGRIVCIAGEHEDHYDPDFCIYNDVIVIHPAPGESWVTEESGQVDVFGYPRSVFPPTDFHSATLVGDRIVIIGCLGYPPDRRQGFTPVYELDLRTMAISERPTSGVMPGWIYEHHAALDPGSRSITVRGGNIVADNHGRSHCRTALYRLHIDRWEWELVRHHERRRCFVLETEIDSYDGWTSPTTECFFPVGVDHTVLPMRYKSDDTHPIDVHGVKVTFINLETEAEVAFEGELPELLVAGVIGAVLKRLDAATGSKWSAREVNGFEEDDFELDLPEE